MRDWADEKASAIVDEPGVLQVWPRAGYCKRCSQPIAASAVYLTKLKTRIADALRGKPRKPDEFDGGYSDLFEGDRDA